MAPQEWLLFGLTVLGVSLIPGPSTVLAFADGARFGARRAFATALGNAAASTLQAAVASAGLGALIVGSALLFSVVKYAGAAYLLYVGVRMWRSAREPIALGPMAASKTSSVMTLFRGGFAVALGNPKAIAFFTALFPQFLSKEGGASPQLIGMTAICGSGALAVAVVYAALGGHVRRMNLRRELMAALQRSVGGLFVLSATGIALTRAE